METAQKEFEAQKQQSFQANTLQKLGITARSEQQLSVSDSGALAIVSGSHIVIYEQGVQAHYISHDNPHISAIAFTPDGRKLAVAQSRKGSHITVYSEWQCRNETKTASAIKMLLKGHKNGVSFLCWSQNGSHLVSTSNEDGTMFIWKDQQRVTKNKLSSKINRIRFTSQGNLITIGKKHLKLYYFRDGEPIRTQYENSWMMDGVQISLPKSLVEKEFVNVSSRNNITALLSSEGDLLLLKDKSIFKGIAIKMNPCIALEVTDKHILVGGPNGRILAFTFDLKHALTFELPPPIDQQNIEKDSEVTQINIAQAQFPDCVGLLWLRNSQVASLYKNRVVFFWQINSSLNTTKAVLSILGHRDEILCAEVLDNFSDGMVFYATSSLDKTVRIWHLYEECFSIHQSVDIAQFVGIKRNAYCKNLTRIIYTEEVIRYLKHTKNGVLLAASEYTLYLYSLTTFSKIGSFGFGGYALCMEYLEAQKLLYVGTSDSFVKVYQIQLKNDSSFRFHDQKVAQCKLDYAVNRIVPGDKSSVFALSNVGNRINHLQKSVVLGEEREATAITTYLDPKAEVKVKYIVKESTLHISPLTTDQKNLSRRSKPGAVKLQNLIGEKRKPSVIRITQSFIITVVTAALPNIISVWDTESREFLYEEQLGQFVNDVLSFDNGNIILFCASGTILIKNYASSFKKVENNFKAWLEQNDINVSGSMWIGASRASGNYGALVHKSSLKSSPMEESLVFPRSSLQVNKIPVPQFSSPRTIAQELSPKPSVKQNSPKQSSGGNITQNDSITDNNQSKLSEKSDVIKYKGSNNKESMLDLNDIINKAQNACNKVDSVQQKTGIRERPDIFESGKTSIEKIDIRTNYRAKTQVGVEEEERTREGNLKKGGIFVKHPTNNFLSPRSMEKETESQEVIQRPRTALSNSNLDDTLLISADPGSVLVKQYQKSTVDAFLKIVLDDPAGLEARFPQKIATIRNALGTANSVQNSIIDSSHKLRQAQKRQLAEEMMNKMKDVLDLIIEDS